MDTSLTQPRRHPVLPWIAVQLAYFVCATAGVTTLMTLGDASGLKPGEVVPWAALVAGVLAAPTLIVTLVVRPPVESRSAIVAAFPCVCLLLAVGVMASPLAVVAVFLPIVGPVLLAMLSLSLAVCGSVCGAVGLARGWWCDVGQEWAGERS